MHKAATSLMRRPLPQSKPITQYSFKVRGAANNCLTSCWLMILDSINCFCGYKGTRQNERHFYYLLVKKNAGTGYTAAFGTACFMHRFNKNNELLNISLCNVGNSFVIAILK